MDVTFDVLDVRKLIMLEAVMAEGTIAAAARRLQYTRSAVSQQISALEAEAGTALIDRTGNRITLTPAGRALVEHAERILVELRSAEATLAGAGTRITGLLRVGIPFREGPHIMSRALTEMRRRFPDMEIRLAAISDEEGPDAVHRDQLDMAIVSRYGNARETARPGLREWTLGHDPLRLCVPPDHPLAGAQRLRDEPAGRRGVGDVPGHLARPPRAEHVHRGGLPAQGGRDGERCRHRHRPGRHRVGHHYRSRAHPCGHAVPRSSGCRSRASTPTGTASSSSATESTCHRGWPRRVSAVRSVSAELRAGLR